MGAETTPEKILVIHLAGLGDLVMGLPALEALRRRYPKSRIHLLTWARHAALVEYITGIDIGHFLQEGLFAQVFLQNFLTALRLRRERLDLAVNLYQVYRRVGVWKLRALLWLIRPRRTAGRNTDGKASWFDMKVDERAQDGAHEVERQLAMVTALGAGVDSAAPRPRLRMDAAEGQAMTRWLGKKGVSPDEALVVIHAGSGRPAHRWPSRKFAELADQLEKAHNVRIVLTGNKRERGLARRIARKLARPVLAAGELSFGQLCALLLRSRLFLSNDSGPMHVASALNVPLVAIFGPGDPHRYGPYPPERPDQVVIYASDCKVCHRQDCDGHAALRRLPVEPVLEAAEAILKGAHPRGLKQIFEPRRVLHVHTLPVISGSGLNTFLCMSGQHAAGFDVELSCARGVALIHLVERSGMRVRALKHMVWEINPWQDALAVLELRSLMRRERYTVVHTHNSKAGFLGRLAAWLAGVPVIVHTVHGFAFHDQETRVRRQLYRLLERLASHWCDRLIVISQPLIDWSLRERIAPKEKMTRIYSGIDIEAFRKPVDTAALRASFGLNAQDFIVGEVAKLWVGKGQDILLRALALLRSRIPHLKLVFIGDGELRASLETLANDLHVSERVVFTGFREDVPALTQMLDIAALPSLFEGMGRAVLEAQAAARPIIGARVGGIPDLIEDGVTGLLIDPGSVEALAKAIEQLWGDPDLRRRLVQNGCSAVDEKFSARTMSKQTIAVYEELIRQKGAR